MNATAMALVIALPLAGCAASRPAETVDGRASYHVQCSSGRQDLCYAEANKLCPQGYDEVPTPGAPSGRPAGTANPATSVQAGGPDVLYISCK
jgi:hypothetical protein